MTARIVQLERCQVYDLYNDGERGVLVCYREYWEKRFDQFWGGSGHDDGGVKIPCHRMGTRTPHGDVLCPAHHREFYACWCGRDKEDPMRGFCQPCLDAGWHLLGSKI